MGPQNAVVGDENFGTDIPRTEVQKEELDAEKRRAKYSKSKEFEELKAHMESRITFYQSYFPGQVPVENIPEEERAKYWAVASILVNEFRAVISVYDEAREAVTKDVVG